MPRELTDAQQMYCELRAQGYTKTEACAKAFPDMSRESAARYGHEMEKSNQRVKDRIYQIQMDMQDAMGLTLEDQIRKYQLLYSRAIEQDDLKMATQILTRIDTLAGLEVKRSETTQVKRTLVDSEGDTKKDLERFSSVISKHSEVDPKSVN